MSRSAPTPLSAKDEVASLREEVRKLQRINAVLMDRVERSSDMAGNAFSMFETAISLETMVRERTSALEDALSRLAAANAELAEAHGSADAARMRLRDAIESINEGFALFDAQDRLVLCNEAYLSMWPEVGTHLEEELTFLDIARLVARNNRPMGAMLAPDRWVSDRLARHSIASGSHVQALADGRWIQINELRTSEGGIVGIYTDITDAKAEDARERARELAERNLVLQATLDTLSEGVGVFDDEGHLTAWNGMLQRLLGLPEELDKSVRTYGDLVDWCRTRLGMEDEGFFDRRSERRAAMRIEQLCRAGDRYFEVRSTAMKGGGRVIGFTDVTEILRAQDSLRETADTLERRVGERTEALQAEINERRLISTQLLEAKTAAEKANLSKTRFLAAASHDLLQPLNAARLFVAALGDRRLALPTRALVKQTSTALDSVEDLLEALLEISRLDAGAIQPELSNFRIDRLLNTLNNEFAPQARTKGLNLHVDAEPLWVRSDLRLLRRILQNFISNALRYTQKGQIQVSCRHEGGLVHVAIKDSGPGIERDQQGLIFEEFRRLDKRPGGKGLGLAIVKRASDMLEHPIALESAPGMGSTFSISVPAGEARVEEDVDNRTTSRDRSMRGLTILVVDNEKQIQSGMRTLLGGWGCTIVTADGYEDAVAQLDEGSRPDVVLADYHLDNDKTGDRVIEQLRAYFAHPLPSIMISADRGEELKGRLAELGIPLLNKPVKPAQLRALLRTILD